MNPNTPRPRNRRTHFHVGQELEAGQRRLQCLNLRIEGCTVRQIGQRLGLSPSTVQAHLQKALADTKEATRAAAMQLRATERIRLEAILARWTPIAMGQGETWEVARAAKIVLKASEALRALYDVDLPAQPRPQAPDPDGKPDDNPADSAFLQSVLDDMARGGARYGFLPKSGYDEAWDALEALKPGEYRPGPQVEAYLRANWSAAVAV